MMKIKGDSNVTVRSYNVSDFTHIAVGGGAQLRVRIAEAWALTVETDENLQEYILPRVENGALRLERRSDISLHHTRLVYTVSLPRLEGVALSGGVHGTVEGRVETEHFAANISGGSRLTAAGIARAQTVNLSGGCHFDGGDLAGQTVTANVSGGSTCRVSASDVLTVSASGGSGVTYTGRPQVTGNVSGGSRVAPAPNASADPLPARM